MIVGKSKIYLIPSYDIGVKILYSLYRILQDGIYLDEGSWLKETHYY